MNPRYIYIILIYNVDVLLNIDVRGAPLQYEL